MKSPIQLLREKVDSALGSNQRSFALFLKLSFSGSTRSLLARYRHGCTNYDYQLSKGKDRETEWLRVRNNLLESLLTLNTFREEILNSQCPKGGNWFERENEFFNAFDLNELINEMAMMSITPIYKSTINHEAELSKSLFIRAIQSQYSISTEQIKSWMSSAVDQSQFTVDLAKEILSQWENCDPEQYGDPFGLWDHLSRRAEALWEKSFL